jgi:hypothetical protein
LPITPTGYDVSPKPIIMLFLDHVLQRPSYWRKDEQQVLYTISNPVSPGDHYNAQAGFLSCFFGRPPTFYSVDTNLYKESNS